MTPAGLALRSYGGEVVAHAHVGHHQLVLARSGALEIEVAGRGGRVDGATAVLIRAGERHAFRAAAEPNGFAVLDLPVAAAAVDRLADRMRARAFVPVVPPLRELLGCVGMLVTPAAPPGLTAAWATLVVAALEAAAGRAADRHDAVLARALACIAAGHGGRLPVAAIARAAGAGESTLFALFRARLGTTPGARLAAVRLERAAALLADPTLSIAEIAARTGHADQSQLTRRMRAAFGVTPAALRRRLTGG